ncbi:MAG TPA: hypothetical protein PKH78_14895, partial [Candidatus Obscuribacter sp.]|nr:hypothetical protein [Candidatus Obscuribacter sp.]
MSTGLDDSLKKAEDFPSPQALLGWVGAALSGFICLFLSFSTIHIFSPGLQERDIADRDLFAPQAASVVDRAETEKAIEKARQSIIPVFQVDRSRDQESLKRIETVFARAESLQAMGIKPYHEAPVAPKTARVKVKGKNNKKPPEAVPEPSSMDKKLQMSLLTLPDDKLVGQAQANLPEIQTQRKAYIRARTAGLSGDLELELALTVDPAEMPAFKAATLESARRLMAKFHRYPVVDKGVWQDVVTEFLPDSLEAGKKQTAALVINENLEANLVIDTEGTKTKAQVVVQGVEPVLKAIKEGEVIVPQGAMITREKLYILQELGITHVNRWPFILSMAISLIAALTLVGLFLYTYEPKHLFSPSSIGLMFTVQVIVASVASLVGKTNPQFVPIPAAALILTIFFGRRTAIALSLPMVLLIGVDRLVDLHYLAAHTLASLGAIMSFPQSGTGANGGRSAVFRTGLVVAFGLVAGDLASTLVDHSYGGNLGIFGRRLLLDFAGGIISSIVAVGSLPFLEKLYGLITPFRLAELTD